MHFLFAKSVLHKFYYTKTMITSLLCLFFMTMISLVLYNVNIFESTFLCQPEKM